MKRSVVPVVISLVALGLTGGGFSASAQHVHLVAGAESQQQDSRLHFANGAAYDTNSNGGITPACFFMTRNHPLYPGLFQTDVTFAALPGTLWTGGPSPGAAAAGAFIEAKIISVSGPQGGEIGFWQENEDATETTKRFGIPVGTSNGTNRFEVSEGITYPEPDPFGHIHGRRFTANKPGLYTVGFQLVDTSTSGTNNGPIHTPSLPSYFYFQAGNYINSVVRTNNTVEVRFGVNSFRDYDLEVNTDLATTNWITINHIVGANHSDIHTFVDTNTTSVSRFYRLRETPQ